MWVTCKENAQCTLASLSGRRWRAEARGPAWRLGGRRAWRRAWLERGLEQEVEVPARAARVEHGLARALAARDELGGLGEVAGEERGVEAAARGGGEGERGGGGGARVHRPPLYPRSRLGEIFLFGGWPPYIRARRGRFFFLARGALVVYPVLAARETAAAMQTAKARARGAHAGLSGVARSGAAGAGAPQGGVSAQ